jgi:hypothetical protein
MILPAGHDWITGKRIRIFWDDPELENYGLDPPAGTA